MLQICVDMIVKDEARVIERGFASCAALSHFSCSAMQAVLTSQDQGECKKW